MAECVYCGLESGQRSHLNNADCIRALQEVIFELKTRIKTHELQAEEAMRILPVPKRHKGVPEKSKSKGDS